MTEAQKTKLKELLERYRSHLKESKTTYGEGYWTGKIDLINDILDCYIIDI
jgi:hypothetical protein